VTLPPRPIRVVLHMRMAPFALTYADACEGAGIAVTACRPSSLTLPRCWGDDGWSKGGSGGGGDGLM